MDSRKLQLDYLSELKSETKGVLGPRVEINEIENYKFRIVNRGDQLFHQEGDRALLIQMNPYDYAIYTELIRKWDNDQKVTEEEKNLIIERAKSYFRIYQNSELKVV